MRSIKMQSMSSLLKIKGIHRYASRLGIENRVLDIATALADFDNKAARMHEHFRIKPDFMYNINHLDPFFDSLREDYGFDEFNDWFIRNPGKEENAGYIGWTTS